MKKESPDRRRSLSRSLQNIISRALVMCLALVFLSVLISEGYYQRQQFSQEINNLTALIARYSAPTLAFDDEYEALAVLEVLASDTRIIKAQLLNASQQELAEYSQDSIDVEEGDLFFIQHPVIDQQETLGELRLWVDRGAYKQQVRQMLVILLAFCVISLALARLLSQRLPASITQSVADLVAVFKRISESKDYTQHARDTDLIELDALVHEFNLMLDEISARDEQLRQSQESLMLALQGSGEGLWDYNMDSGWFHCDERCYELVGLKSLPKHDSLREWLRRMHPQDRESLFNELRKHFSGESGSFEVECRLRSCDGYFHWAIIHGMITKKSDDKIQRISGTVMDNNERHQAVEESQLLAAVFQNTHEPVVVVNAKLNIQAANEAFAESMGGKAQGQHLDKALDHNYDSHFFECIGESLSADGTWEGEVRLNNKHGGHQIMWLSFVPVGGNKKDNFLGSFSIIEQRQKIEDELRYLANYDSLTSLPNRRMFNERLKHALLLAQRHNNCFAIFFLDLNNFKIINDTLGHSVGDKLLVETAKRLKLPLRETDTIARLGGDEFVVLTEFSGDHQDAEFIAKRLLAVFKEPVVCGEHRIEATTSIGIACYPSSADTIEGLMINADLAMYQAKQMGANFYAFFRQEWGEQAERRTRIRQELANAVELNQFYIVLQPKFDLQTLEIYAAEVLLRWEHPQLGMISPVEFIPVAEECGLIEPIGNWVLMQTVELLQQWGAGSFNNLSLAVNVSAVQFSENKLPCMLRQLINAYDFSVHLLELELTESLLLKSGETSQVILKTVKEMGFPMSIDDFGTGYSSLQYLSNFPVDYLKVDQSFVRNLSTDERCKTIIKAIVAMAEGLEMKVIAEGIETQEQLQLLTTMGCDFGQGYWCSSPLKTADFEIFVNNWRKQTWQSGRLVGK